MIGMRWREALDVIEMQAQGAYWSAHARRLMDRMHGPRWDDDTITMIKTCQAEARNAYRNARIIGDAE